MDLFSSCCGSSWRGFHLRKEKEIWNKMVKEGPWKFILTSSTSRTRWMSGALAEWGSLPASTWENKGKPEGPRCLKESVCFLKEQEKRIVTTVWEKWLLEQGVKLLQAGVNGGEPVFRVKFFESQTIRLWMSLWMCRLMTQIPCYVWAPGAACGIPKTSKTHREGREGTHPTVPALRWERTCPGWGSLWPPGASLHWGRSTGGASGSSQEA